jgi:hypothetical protein
VFCVVNVDGLRRSLSAAFLPVHEYVRYSKYSYDVVRTARRLCSRTSAPGTVRVTSTETVPGTDDYYSFFRPTSGVASEFSRMFLRKISTKRMSENGKCLAPKVGLFSLRTFL